MKRAIATLGKRVHLAREVSKGVMQSWGQQRLPRNDLRASLIVVALLPLIGATCGETSNLTASGDLSGPFKKSGPPLCGRMEGQFGSTQGGYVSLEWDDQQMTLTVKVDGRIYTDPSVPLARQPNGSTPGKYVFQKVKLDLASGPGGGTNVILDGTLLCEGGGWFGVPD
jgi:hypothetical protein